MLRRITDWRNPLSLSNRLRSERMSVFESLLGDFTRPVRILDIGGTQAFSERRDWADRDDIRITLVNLNEEKVSHPTITSVKGDATNLTQFDSKSFDIVFSNSVIEHLFTWQAQESMASEVSRLGHAYFVQTPNFWFPIEPHFHWPGWQWLPTGIRVSLLRRFRCGRRGPCPDAEEARKLVEEVKLLTRHQLATLFPDATIVPERFAGMTKSWMALRHRATGSGAI